MSLYLRITPKGELIYPYNLGSLKYDFPTTTFSSRVSPALLNARGIYPVVENPKPNLPGKIYSELEPEYIDGIYYQRWQESDDDPVRIEMIRNQKWAEIRQIRNGLLSQSDFTMLEDFPDRGRSLQAWKNYRKELRDITKQSDPYNIVWPVKPE